MRGYLVPGGTYYGARHWNATVPGTHYEYSNIGVALAGELVERITGEDLQTYSERRIFAPLGMTESSWFLRGLDRGRIAMPYKTSASGRYIAAGHYGYPTYPDGQLRTSARQLARFLMMFGRGGELDGARILAPSTVAEMRTRQAHSHEGLSLQYARLDDTALVGHRGADVGMSTDMWIDPETGAGIVVLTNSDVFHSHLDELASGNYGRELAAVIEIEEALLALAK